MWAQKKIPKFIFVSHMFISTTDISGTADSTVRVVITMDVVYDINGYVVRTIFNQCVLARFTYVDSCVKSCVWRLVPVYNITTYFWMILRLCSINFLYSNPRCRNWAAICHRRWYPGSFVCLIQVWDIWVHIRSVILWLQAFKRRRRFIPGISCLNSITRSCFVIGGTMPWFIPSSNICCFSKNNELTQRICYMALQALMPIGVYIQWNMAFYKINTTI